MYVTRETEGAGPQRTAFAALVAILMVIPAIIPAAIATIVYSFIFQIFIGGGSWIPYVDEIGALWFPEALRGLILGAVAVWTSRYFFPRSNIDAVRFATLAFWGALLVLLLILSVAFRGMTLDTIGVVALLFGLAIGLWSNE